MWICCTADTGSSWAPTGKKRRQPSRRYTASEKRIDFLKQILRDMLDDSGTYYRSVRYYYGSPKFMYQKVDSEHSWCLRRSPTLNEFVGDILNSQQNHYEHLKHSNTASKHISHRN